jgi:hypothetical protein
MMMTRTSFRPVASVGLVAAVLIYVGCSKGPETANLPTPSVPAPLKRFEGPGPAKLVSTAPEEKKPAAPKGKQVPKVITEWSAKPPVAILVISGEQDGYPDPCGCTDGQLGGLGRRYDFLEKLQAKGWPLVKIDLGNLIQYRGNSRGGEAQEKIKFDVIHKALGAMRYDAVALGPEDLKPSIFDTLGALLNFPEPKFLAANVKPADKEFAEAILPTRFVSVGGLTIGITAVLDPGSYKALQDANAAMLEVKPPDDVLADVLVDLRRRSQATVLMVQGSHEEAKRLAEKFKGFDIVVGTSESSDPDDRPEYVNGGATLLVRNVGKKGKHLGLVGFFPQAEPRMVYRRQALDAKHFDQAEPMRLLVDKEYQEMLKAQGVVENFIRANNGQAPGASYVGAEACQKCHPKTFEKWASTKHARAYEPLTNPRRERIHDAECISCHTTGFGYVSGWVSAEKTPNLKGNQCENCHGPASLHLADPDNLAHRNPMHLTAETAKSNAFCTKCHDEDNSPHFNFDSFYPQIFHKGLDDYADPKVHEKQPAAVAGAAK